MSRESPSEAWLRCLPWIERAVRRSDSPGVDEVKARVEAGNAVLIYSPKAVLIGEVTKDAHCWLAGGSMAEIIELHPALERMARAQGCDRMTVRGRPGWERVLAPLGYHPLTYLVKELT